MSRPPFRPLDFVLAAGAFVVLFGALLRSRVQAWEAKLTASDLNWVKALVVASVAVFIVTVVALTLARRRATRKPEKPD